MLRQQLALKQVLLVLILAAVACVGGFSYFWNHRDRLVMGNQGASNASVPAPLTGLIALKVLPSLPQHRSPSIGGAAAAPGAPPSRPAGNAPGGARSPKASPVVHPIQIMTRLPEYRTSDDLYRQVRVHVAGAVQKAGVKVLLPSDDAADVDGSAEPDRAYMNVTVNANRANNGVWIETEMELTRSIFSLRQREDARLSHVTAWQFRTEPELYREADVDAAILAQVDRGMESFLRAYQQANPGAAPASDAKSE